MTEDFLHQLLKQYHVPHHIKAHMKKVAAVCLFLGNRLLNSGEKIDLILVRQAALLHDILKLGDFKKLNLQYFHQPYSKEDIHFWSKLIESASPQGHAEAAYELLIKIGEPQLALTVKKHRFNCLIEASGKPQTWEEKILYYADKRVKHDQIVSIQERLEDGRKRYFSDGYIPSEDAFIEKALFQLEQEICDVAMLKPEEINEKNIFIYLENER